MPKVNEGWPALFPSNGEVYQRTEPLPLEVIHPFWKTLNIYESHEELNEVGQRRRVNRNLMDELAITEFNNLTVEEQDKAIIGLKKIVRPYTTKLDEQANVKHKGRPVGALNKRLPSAWEYTKRNQEEEGGTPPNKQKGKG